MLGIIKTIHFLIGVTIGTALFVFATFASQENPSEKSIINLNSAAQQMAGITVSTIQPRKLKRYVSAPGEVIPNADSITKITTRVPVKIVRRIVQEGQHVKVGQPLVILTSVDVSKIQADLVLASQEWERVKSLGKDAISAKRFSEAQIAYESAYQTALASGLSDSEIQRLIQSKKISQGKNEFGLTAPRSGTAFNVNIIEGELAEPGQVLLQIIDEASVWVDAKLPPELAHKVQVGNKANVQAEEHIIPGNIIQVTHQLDETTRTRSIRIQVPNLNDLLHPGQFVNCQIETGQTVPVLAVPVDAVVRTSDGDSAIYLEVAPNKFQQAQIKILEVIDNQAIIEGILPGKRVVIKGAFFIHAELNKKAFDAHGD